MIHNKDLTDGCAVPLSCKAEQVLCFLLHPVTLYVPGGLVYVRSAGNKCSTDELSTFGPSSLLLSSFGSLDLVFSVKSKGTGAINGLWCCYGRGGGETKKRVDRAQCMISW